MPTRSKSAKDKAKKAAAKSPKEKEPAEDSADEKPPTPADDAAKDANDDEKEEEAEGKKPDGDGDSDDEGPESPDGADEPLKDSSKEKPTPAAKDDADGGSSVEKPPASPASKATEDEKKELAKEGGDVVDDAAEPAEPSFPIPTSVPSGLIVKSYTGPSASGSGSADYYASRNAGASKPVKAHILSLSLESLPKSSGDGGKASTPGTLLGPAKAPWMELDRVGPHLLGEKWNNMFFNLVLHKARW